MPSLHKHGNSAQDAPQASSSRLLIKPLAANMTAKDLREYFKQSGFTLTEAQVMTDKGTRKSRGFGFVGLGTTALAADAIRTLNGGWMYGRKISLAVARDIKPSASHANGAEPKKRKDQPVVTDDAAVNEAVSDMEYLQKRKRRKLQDEREEVQDMSGTTADAPSNPNRRRLFIRGVLHTATEEELQTHFLEHDLKCEALSVPLSTKRAAEDPNTFLNKGIAFVDFVDTKDASQAIEKLSGRPFRGRNLFMHLTTSDRPLKPLASSSTVKTDSNNIQDSLVLNQDAVLTATANRLGLNKSEVLDPTSSASAAKLAIAETTLIDETRSYFQQRGIDLDKVSGKTGGKKSKTTLLIKNLPGDMIESSLKSLLSTYGEIKRFLMPTNGTLAAAEFESPDAAGAAHGGLAYRKVGNSVLYVEKPLATFWDTAKDVPESSQVVRISSDEDGSNHIGTPSSTLFVKNLAFKTKETDFARLFNNMPGFIFARIQQKAGAKQQDGGSDLFRSLGYGFVGFKDATLAGKALEVMKGYRMDGHELQIQFAQNDSTEEGRNMKVDSSKIKSTTLVIKNVPFEANSKDLKDLIGAFSNIKSLRVPKGANGKTRGFAFVDFSSKEDAIRAIQGLKHTHLYGRHLVLEPQTKASMATAVGESALDAAST